MYSNIRFRAGLVALVIALISLSLVSAVPIPISALQPELSSTLSSPSSQLNHLQHDTPRITKSSLNGQMSRAPAAARALAHKHNLVDTDDDQLVRRNIFSKIKKGFQKVGSAIKHAAQKVGSGIKKAAQKVGSGIKKAAQKVGSGIKTAAQKVGSGVKKAAQKVGSGIKKVAQKVGSGIKKVAQKVGSGIKKVAQKVGSGIKTAAKKVGKFVKTTGAKVAKFGLKVVQSVGMAVGAVASFIPEVGKGVQQVINGVSKVAGAVSDRIHVKLSAKLQKGVNVMNTANKITGLLRREEEAFQQRDDIRAAYYFEQPDDISVEYEEFYFDDDYEHYLDRDN